VVRFPGTYEVGIDANIVNGQHIAASFGIAQDPLNTVSGFIEKIDYANGVLYVNGQRTSSMIRKIIHQRSDQMARRGRHLPRAAIARQSPDPYGSR